MFQPTIAQAATDAVFGIWKIIRLLRFPIGLSLVFCLLLYLPAQSIDHIIDFAHKVAIASQSSASWHYLTKPTALVAVVLVALLAVYSFEVAYDYLDEHPASRLNGIVPQTILYLLVYFIAAAPAYTISVIAHRGADRIKLAGEDAAELIRELGDINLASELTEHVDGYFRIVLVALFVGCLLRFFGRMRRLGVPNSHFRARAVVFFGIAPAFALLAWGCLFLLVQINPLAISKLGVLQTTGILAVIALVVGASLSRVETRTGMPVFIIGGLLWLVANVFLGADWLEKPVARQIMDGDKQQRQELIALQKAIADKEAGEFLSDRVAEAKAMGHTDVTVSVLGAQGGGIYAAYHAAIFLAKASEFDPAIPRRLFAISAVSGGSVGAAVFRRLDTATAVFQRQNSADRLRLLREPTDRSHACSMYRARSADVSMKVRQFFDFDFLSPMLVAGATVDFVRIFGVPTSRLPVSDRGRALSQVLEKRMHAVRNDDAEDQPLTWSRDALRPAYFFNVTSAGSGRRLYIGPFSIEGDPLIDGMAGKSERIFFLNATDQSSVLSFDAAMASASFPAVMPPAFVQPIKAGSAVRLVDGGYFDNSGLATGLDAVHSLQRVLRSKGTKIVSEGVKTRYSLDGVNVKISLISLNFSDRRQRDTTEPFGFGDIASPVLAVERGRRARAQEFVQEAKELAMRSSDFSVLEVSIDDEQRQLALGWTWSAFSRSIVDASVKSFEKFGEQLAPRSERICN